LVLYLHTLCSINIIICSYISLCKLQQNDIDDEKDLDLSNLRYSTFSSPVLFDGIYLTYLRLKLWLHSLDCVRFILLEVLVFYSLPIPSSCLIYLKIIFFWIWILQNVKLHSNVCLSMCQFYSWVICCSLLCWLWYPFAVIYYLIMVAGFGISYFVYYLMMETVNVKVLIIDYIVLDLTRLR